MGCIWSKWVKVLLANFRIWAHSHTKHPSLKSWALVFRQFRYVFIYITLGPQFHTYTSYFTSLHFTFWNTHLLHSWKLLLTWNTCWKHWVLLHVYLWHFLVMFIAQIKECHQFHMTLMQKSACCNFFWVGLNHLYAAPT